MLFSPAEKKIIDGVSKVSTNQNRALLIRKFLSFLISTNQNRASMGMESSTNLKSTNQN